MPIGPPDLSSTVERFSFPITRRRYGSSTTNADGMRVRGAAVDTEILAHAWDAPADVLANMPEGQIGTRVIEGHTTSSLRIADEGNDVAADVLIIGGLQYEVIQVTDWRAGPAGATAYYRFLATEVDR